MRLAQIILATVGFTVAIVAYTVNLFMAGNTLLFVGLTGNAIQVVAIFIDR